MQKIIIMPSYLDFRSTFRLHKSRGDPRNLLCCILGEGGERIKLGSVNGKIDTMYCRSQFTPTSFQGMTDVNVNKAYVFVGPREPSPLVKIWVLFGVQALKNLCLGERSEKR